jgi:hypothetical protein
MGNFGIWVCRTIQPTQGFGQHGSSLNPIDRPTYSHLGKKIKWSDLPTECQKCVLDTYCDLWDIVNNQQKLF